MDSVRERGGVDSKRERGGVDSVREISGVASKRERGGVDSKRESRVSTKSFKMCTEHSVVDFCAPSPNSQSCTLTNSHTWA